MKLYCQKCYNPTSYTDTRPAFCSSCGNPFTTSNSSVITPKIKSKPKPPPPPEDDDDDNYEEENRPPITDVPKLQFETLSNLRNRVSLKNLGADPTPKQEIQRQPKKKQTFKKFQEEWADEVKSSKGKNSSIDEE